MKISRRDIINVLKKRLRAKLTTELNAARFEFYAASDKYENLRRQQSDNIEELAIKEFKKIPEVSDVIKRLDAASVEYSIGCHQQSCGDGVYKCHVNLHFSIIETVTLKQKPEDSLEVAIANAAMDMRNINGKLDRTERELNHRLEDSSSLIEDAISDMLVEGDESINKLIAQIEDMLEDAIKPNSRC